MPTHLEYRLLVKVSKPDAVSQDELMDLVFNRHCEVLRGQGVEPIDIQLVGPVDFHGGEQAYFDKLS